MQSKSASNTKLALSGFSRESISKKLAWSKWNKNRGGFIWRSALRGCLSVEFFDSSYMFDKTVPVRECKLSHLLSVKKSKHVQSAPPPGNSHTHIGISSRVKMRKRCTRCFRDLWGMCVFVCKDKVYVGIVWFMCTLQCLCVCVCVRLCTHWWEFVLDREESRKKKSDGRVNIPIPLLGPITL